MEGVSGIEAKKHGGKEDLQQGWGAWDEITLTCTVTVNCTKNELSSELTEGRKTSAQCQTENGNQPNTEQSRAAQKCIQMCQLNATVQNKTERKQEEI